jgi:hypothetical protein
MRRNEQMYGDILRIPYVDIPHEDAATPQYPTNISELSHMPPPNRAIWVNYTESSGLTNGYDE